MSRRVLLSLLLSFPAFAQFSKDPFTNEVMRQAAGWRGIGDYVGDAAREIGNWIAEKAKLNAEIAQAREEFWRAYPNGPGYEKARGRFALALQHKDQYYLLTEAVGAGSPEFAAFGSIGGEIDGGIRPALAATFSQWTMQVRKNIGGGGPKTWQLLFEKGNAKAEIEQARPLYQIYEVRRDLEEFRVKGIKPPGIDPALWGRVQLAVSIRERASITDPAHVMDPYSYAFEHSGDQADFGPACRDYIAKLAPKSKPSACSCIRQVFLQNGEPADVSRLDSKFNEQDFLLTAVSRVGMYEKVATCLR